MLLNLEFKHCYGIGGLKETFEFDESKPGGRAYCIYASNGVMKSSFAKTLEDYAFGRETCDSIFEGLTTVRKITDGASNPMDPKSIFVVHSFDKKFESDKIPVLLANDALRTEYEGIIESVNRAKKAVLDRIADALEIRKLDLEVEIIKAYGKKDIYEALEAMNEELSTGRPQKYDQLVYEDIFNDKTTRDILNKPDVVRALHTYTAYFKTLTASSKYFREGIFDHTKAETISDALGKNNYFDAGHEILLKEDGGGTKQIGSKQALDTLIAEEERRIMNDETIRANFVKIDSKIKKNIEGRKFRDYIANHQEIIPELLDSDKLKRELFAGVFIGAENVLTDFAKMLSFAKEQIETVVEKARIDKTLWTTVVEKFNNRFFVPFRVKIGNQEDVILKKSLPVFKFIFEDRNGKQKIDRNELIDVLSTGEQRALYLLNILFEIEARKFATTPQIIVFDDVVDSFDYKNKYAILEYLKEISKDERFYSIILTHNFDFYRSIEAKHIAHYKNLRVARRHEDGTIKLTKPDYVKNPFKAMTATNKKEEEKGPEAFIAVIPYCRNLVEYTNYANNSTAWKSDFDILTSALHMKSDTTDLTVSKLHEVIIRTIPGFVTETDLTQKYLDLLFNLADGIAASGGDGLKAKAILSVASRLKAEKYMIKEISDPIFVANIDSNQTGKLFDRYKTLPERDSAIVELLEEVNIITPDTIHINAFMFEPLVDVSIDALRKLYKKLSELEA